MKYTEQFPKPEGEQPTNPGERPSLPPGLGYEPSVKEEFFAACRKWEEDRKAFNGYGVKMRKHWIAQAVDSINSKGDHANALEKAILVLGVDYLEKGDNQNSVFGLFGGLL